MKIRQWFGLVCLTLVSASCARLNEPQAAHLASSFGSVGADSLYSVAAGPAGTVCAEGEEMPEPTMASRIFLRCFDKNGTTTFLNFFEPIAINIGVRVDSKGSSYAVIQRQNSGTEALTYLEKYASDGAQLWSSRLDISPNASNKLVIDSNDRPLYTEDEVNELFRFSRTGELVSRKRVSFGAYYGLEVSGKGNLYTLGNAPVKQGDGDCLHKYRPDGVKLWSNLCGKLYGALDLTTTAEDTVYMASDIDDNVLLYKLASTGETLWRRVVAPSKTDLELAGISADEEGNVYVAATVQDVLEGVPSRGDKDVLVRKYTPDGRSLWTRRIGTPGKRDEATDIDARESDVVFVGGVLDAFVNGRPIRGVQDAFMLKLTRGGRIAWAR